MTEAHDIKAAVEAMFGLIGRGIEAASKSGKVPSCLLLPASWNHVLKTLALLPVSFDSDHNILFWGTFEGLSVYTKANG